VATLCQAGFHHGNIMKTAEFRYFLLGLTSNHLKSTSNVEEPFYFYLYTPTLREPEKRSGN
jgi:hypothetical protein